MPFDVQAWLKELAADGSLSDQELGTLQASLSKPQVVKRLEEGQLRQADYSRAMNSLREKETATANLQAELVQWKKDQEKVIQKANATVGEKAAAHAALQAKVQAYAEANGLDATEILGAEPAAPPANPNPNPNPQNPQYLTREDWQKDYDAIRNNFPLLPAQIADLQVEHQTLFGKPLANSTELVQKAMAAQKPIRQVWEEDFKVADRRKEIAEAEIQQRIDAGVQAKLTQLRSEGQIPQQTALPQSARSPVLAEFSPQPTARKDMSAVDAAVAHFMEHHVESGAGA